MATSLIICTPGGDADNCYVTLLEADGHFAYTLREMDWQGWTVSDRERALIQATVEIERLGGQKAVTSAARCRFPGEPRTTTQALHFPRAVDVTSEGDPVIPQAVREAVCEQAYYLLFKRDNPDLLPREELQARGVRAVAVDGLSESYGAGRVPEGIAVAAWASLRPYVRRSWPTTR